MLADDRSFVNNMSLSLAIRKPALLNPTQTAVILVQINQFREWSCE